MPWKNYVIDATMGWPPCFCPIEDDHTIVTGMNMLGLPPPGTTVVGIVHEGGQEAADAFYDEHRHEIEDLLQKHNGK